MPKKKVIQRNTPERIQRAKFLVGQRSAERESYQHAGTTLHFFQTNGGIAGVQRMYSIDLARVAREMRGREKRPLSFLDLGAGQGITGLELQEVVGRQNMNVHAISLSRPFSRKGTHGRDLESRFPDARERFAAFRVGEYEKKQRAFFGKRKFDIIFSSIMSGSVNDILRIASRLTPRGVALCILEADSAADMDRATSMLKQKGFAITILDRRLRPYQNRPSRPLFLLSVRHVSASRSS